MRCSIINAVDGEIHITMDLDPCWNVRKGARMQSTAKYVWCALNRTLTTMDELEKVIEGTAKDIGICELRKRQYIYLWAAKMVLFPCRQGMAS